MAFYTCFGHYLCYFCRGVSHTAQSTRQRILSCISLCQLSPCRDVLSPLWRVPIWHTRLRRYLWVWLSSLSCTTSHILPAATAGATYNCNATLSYRRGCTRQCLHSTCCTASEHAAHPSTCTAQSHAYTRKPRRSRKPFGCSFFYITTTTGAGHFCSLFNACRAIPATPKHQYTITFIGGI